MRPTKRRQPRRIAVSRPDLAVGRTILQTWPKQDGWNRYSFHRMQRRRPIAGSKFGRHGILLAWPIGCSTRRPRFRASGTFLVPGTADRFRGPVCGPEVGPIFGLSSPLRQPSPPSRRPGLLWSISVHAGSPQREIGRPNRPQKARVFGVGCRLGRNRVNCREGSGIHLPAELRCPESPPSGRVP